MELINGDGSIIQWICKTEEEAYKLVQDKKIPVTIRRVNWEDVFINITGRRIE